EVDVLLRRRRDTLDQQVEQGSRAEILRRDGTGDREDLSARDRVLERVGDLFVRELLTVEVALHQRLVRLDDGVEQLLAVLVDQVDLAALPLEMAERGGQRHLPLVLVVVPVAGRIAGLDRAEPVDRAGLEEHRLDERGLTRRAVADDGDVADLSGLDGHLAGLLLGSVARSILSLRFPRDLVRGHGWGPGPRPWLGTRSPVISSSAMPWWEQAVVYQIYP